MALVWISVLGTFSAIVYVALLISLGWATLQNGRRAWFVIGFIIPILWILGGILPPKPGSPGEQKFIKRYAGRDEPPDEVRGRAVWTGLDVGSLTEPDGPPPKIPRG